MLSFGYTKNTAATAPPTVVGKCCCRVLLPRTAVDVKCLIERSPSRQKCLCSPTGLQYELWYVQGATPVKQKWVNCLKELKTEEPHCRVFAKKTDSSIIAHYNDLVAKQSSENGEALRESGGGTAPDSSEDSESEKEMKIRLVSRVEPGVVHVSLHVARATTSPFIPAPSSPSFGLSCQFGTRYRLGDKMVAAASSPCQGSPEIV